MASRDRLRGCVLWLNGTINRRNLAADSLQKAELEILYSIFRYGECPTIDGPSEGSECAQSEDPVCRVDARQYPLADQVAQGFAGAAAERAVARPAVKTRHREFVGEAVA